MTRQSRPQHFGDVEPSQWPGERLGLPKSGSLSIARLGRRVAAFVIDSLLTAIIKPFFNPDPNAAWVTLVIFAAMQIIFIPTIGGSIGHRIMGLRVIRLGGGWVGVWRPVVRTLLILLLVPVLVWDSDNRGFHDKIPGTALVRA